MQQTQSRWYWALKQHQSWDLYVVFAHAGEHPDEVPWEELRDVVVRALQFVVTRRKMPLLLQFIAYHPPARHWLLRHVGDETLLQYIDRKYPSFLGQAVAAAMCIAGRDRDDELMRHLLATYPAHAFFFNALGGALLTGDQPHILDMLARTLHQMAESNRASYPAELSQSFDTNLLDRPPLWPLLIEHGFYVNYEIHELGPDGESVTTNLLEQALCSDNMDMVNWLVGHGAHLPQDGPPPAA